MYLQRGDQALSRSEPVSATALRSASKPEKIRTAGSATDTGRMATAWPPRCLPPRSYRSRGSRWPRRPTQLLSLPQVHADPALSSAIHRCCPVRAEASAREDKRDSEAAVAQGGGGAPS